MSDSTVIVDGELAALTEKAAKVKWIGSNGSEYDAWIPRSQIVQANPPLPRAEQKKPITLRVKKWIVEKNGIPFRDDPQSVEPSPQEDSVPAPIAEPEEIECPNCGMSFLPDAENLGAVRDEPPAPESAPEPEFDDDIPF